MKWDTEPSKEGVYPYRVSGASRMLTAGLMAGIAMLPGTTQGERSTRGMKGYKVRKRKGKGGGSR